MFLFFVECYGDHRDLHVLTHSFPTRRASDLDRFFAECPHVGFVVEPDFSDGVEARLTGAEPVGVDLVVLHIAAHCRHVAAHGAVWVTIIIVEIIAANALLRSEERRLGKGGVSTCRSWGSPYH